MTVLPLAEATGFPAHRKTRVLERKLENWWKRKITLQVGFVGIFIMLRGSAVRHRGLHQTRQRGDRGWNGGHWYHHAHRDVGEEKGERPRCLSSGNSAFSAAQNTYLAPLIWRAEKGIQAESTEIKARCLGKRKGSNIKPLWRSQEDQDLKTWCISLNHCMHSLVKPIFVPSSSSAESHIQLSLMCNLCVKWEKDFFSFWEDVTIE